ncbi:MAG: diguanylate cyclase, partial [Pseudooceanicola sp.]|nr:diguanylate cyclase [Pseudooceanicola sp.]
LDAIVSPPLHATAVDLAYWLAGELGAAEFVLMSRDELPQGTVPARRDLMEETP